jgi:hypothetical protein
MEDEAYIEEGSQEGARAEFKAPYIPFRRILNLADRMLEEGTPGRIDRGYLSNLSGTDRSYLITALRTLGLMGEQGEVTDTMKALVSRETRKQTVGVLVAMYYTRAIQLGDNATQDQLLEVFREYYGVGGETARKAATFYLQAAQFAEMPLSPHFKVAKTSSGTSTNGSTSRTRRRRTTTTPKPPPPATTTSMESLRTRYIEMLMKKVESQDEMDDDTLNRIEALLGYDEGEDALDDE